jgi:DinB superfamily
MLNLSTMDFQFPIGRFQRPTSLDATAVNATISSIADLPARLNAAVQGLTPAQLDTPYRDGGWSVRQVVHHVPESHANAYTRIKLALTESNPVVKPYDESEWAKTPEVRTTPIGVSLLMLEALHARWVLLLRALSPEQWGKTFQHPESGLWRVDQVAALYAWHGTHHVAHVTSLRERSGW